MRNYEPPRDQVVSQIREWIKERGFRKARTFEDGNGRRIKLMAEAELKCHISNMELISAFHLSGFECRAFNNTAFIKCSRIQSRSNAL